MGRFFVILFMFMTGMANADEHGLIISNRASVSEVSCAVSKSQRTILDQSAISVFVEMAATLTVSGKVLQRFWEGDPITVGAISAGEGSDGANIDFFQKRGEKSAPYITNVLSGDPAVGGEEVPVSVKYDLKFTYDEKEPTEVFEKEVWVNRGFGKMGQSRVCVVWFDPAVGKWKLKN